MRGKRGGPVTPAGSHVDLSTTVGSVVLPNPVLTAAGTSGHGAELGGYFDLSELGAVVVKSLSAMPWAGNPAPRVAEVSAGMINSVGLQNAGVDHWVAHDLPALRRGRARVVASIWGFTVDEYEAAAAALRPACAASEVIAVEVNVSCPNIEDRRHMFGHSEAGTSAVIRAVRRGLGPGVALWAKLSPNVTSVVDIAAAAVEAGADALTLINTLMGLAIDPDTKRSRLGAGGGGLSGPAIRPVAVRAVFETRRALPGVPIIGVGGVACGADAVELLVAGAAAIGVGTATFYEPKAPLRVARELRAWCVAHGITSLNDLIGAAHE